MRADWNAGNVGQSAKIATKEVLESSTTDKLIWLLEDGAVSRANADFNRSITSFEKAYAQIQQYESQPATKLTEQTKALLTNQSYIPYKGYNYDKIMLCIYQALNYIELGDFERASVELKRMANFQDNAKVENLKRIQAQEKALQEANKNSSTANYDVSKVLANGKVSANLNSIYGDSYKNSARVQASAVYVNPFGYWLGGLFFANAYDDNADKEMSASMFRLCAESLGGKSLRANDDALRAERLAQGQTNAFGNSTYIIFETGSAPIRKQIRIDLPLFLIGNHVPHVAVNFPYLSKQGSFRASVDVLADSQKVKFDTIADIDSIVQEEFNIHLPYVITKTILSSAGKATGQYFASKAAGDMGILVDLTMGAYQSIMNDADLRTWVTLPKQIKVARVDTPKNGKITIAGKTIDVDTNGVNVIFVKSMSATSNILVRKIEFNKKLKRK